jgi:hypothetical protein
MIPYVNATQATLVKSLTYRTTPTPVLDLLTSLITPKTNRPRVRSTRWVGVVFGKQRLG